MEHYSVLLNESIKGLNIQKNGIYVDATLGLGGHSSRILETLENGHLYCFDQDDYAIEKSEQRLSKINDKYTIIRSNFKDIKVKLNELGVDRVDGILFDLGVSSPQLDNGERGFSYKKDARLDMRMDTSKNFSAYNVVNEYDYENLVRVFRDYGEEKFSSSIAKNILKKREEKNIETTLELVDIIKSSMPMKAMRDKHPAKKVFQAIRIEVNDELGVLKTALEDSLNMLNKGGRICVITFQSLEDKIVKEIFNKYTSVDDKLKNLPFIPIELQPKYKIITKGITPSREELEENNRSHSARLRIIEKI